MSFVVVASSRCRMPTIVALICLLGLTACGGSGGDNGGSEPPPPIGGPPGPDNPPPPEEEPPGPDDPAQPPDDGDNTPLALTGSTPETGATDVLRKIEPTLTFSTNLNVATVNASTVSLRGPTGDVPLMVTANGTQLTITPARELTALMPYTITVSTGIRGNLGQTLAAPVSVSFTSADAHWQTDARITMGQVHDSDFLQIARDPEGNVIAVWQELIGLSQNIMSSRYTPATKWSTPEPLDHTNDDAFQPHIAFDSNGNGMAVWIQYDGNSVTAWASRYVAGTWGAAEPIERDDVHEFDSLRVAIHPNGDAIAVWREPGNEESRFDMWASYFTGGTWGEPKPIEDDDAGSVFIPHVAFDPAGNALVVWEQTFDGIRLRAAANRFTAGEWGQAAIIDSRDGVGHENLDSFLLDLAIDSQGNAFAVWREDGLNSHHILVNRYTTGEEWGTPRQLDTPDSVEAFDAQIAFDASDNAVAVWNQTADVDAPLRLWSRCYPREGEWESPVAVEDGTELAFEDDTHPAFEPQIAFDADGNARALWVIDGPIGGSLWSNRFAQGAWSAPKRVSTDKGFEVTLPSLEVDSSGNALATWLDFSTGPWSIWFNRLE